MLQDFNFEPSTNSSDDTGKSLKLSFGFGQEQHPLATSRSQRAGRPGESTAYGNHGNYSIDRCIAVENSKRGLILHSLDAIFRGSAGVCIGGWGRK